MGFVRKSDYRSFESKTIKGYPGGEFTVGTEGKRLARKSLLISLIIHGAIFIFLAIYVIGSSPRVQELMDAMFLPESKPQKYEPRPRIVKPVVTPSPPQSQVVNTESIPVLTPKRSSLIPGRTAKTDVSLRSAGDMTLQNAVSPSSLARDRIVPKVMTTAKVLPADSVLPSSVSGDTSGQEGLDDRLGGSGGIGAGGGGRSRSGSAAAEAARVAQTLSIVRTHAALNVSEGLAEVAKGVRLGPSRVPPLPKGEPGGIVIGRGKDMEGRIRFTRIKHCLADWWADPTSVPAVVYWMNTRTKIRADMNIEGGSLMLDSPKLMKCPLAIMTGHDRALLTANDLRGNYRRTLVEQERQGLRRYLIEAGGFLFFDECGHDLDLANHVKAELRAALPEHNVSWISNNHELYTCYYDLGGPPLGAYVFWTHGPRSNWIRNVVSKHLQGLFINDRLAAIISDRDYLCAARTKSRPGHEHKGESASSTYKFLTNVIVYSLTHGGISEYTDYIPEMTDADRISIDSPVPVPALIPSR